MGFIRGEAREQVSLFPATLDELIPEDHACRVIEALVNRLEMARLGFVRSEPAETGRPGYDPRDLLKLYLYGYMQQVRSSRRLAAECTRNVEVMWLLGRLRPDYKSIAEFRRMHLAAVTEAGAELVQLARAAGLVKGEWVAIDGSKFRAVSSASRVRERDAMKRYLEQLDAADEQEEVVIDHDAAKAALEKLRRDPEPDATFMRGREGKLPAYNVQIAVDAERGLIVAQQVTTEKNDLRSLLPMAEAARKAVAGERATLNVVADAGYSSGEQVQACEERGLVPHLPVQRTLNNQGDGELFGREQFQYQAASDTYRCPAGQSLQRRNNCTDRPAVIYAAEARVCGICPLKARCTGSGKRIVKRHLYEDGLERTRQRTTPATMALRKSLAEHPFALLKYRIFGHPRFLLRNLRGARIEIGLGILALNLKRMMKMLGGKALAVAIAG